MASQPRFGIQPCLSVGIFYSGLYLLENIFSFSKLYYYIMFTQICKVFWGNFINHLHFCSHFYYTQKLKTISNLPLNNKIGTKFGSSYFLYDNLIDDKSILR